MVITLKAETTKLSVCDVFDGNAIDDNKLLSSKHTTKQINLAILASVANNGSATTKKKLIENTCKMLSQREVAEIFIEKLEKIYQELEKTYKAKLNNMVKNIADTISITNFEIDACMIAEYLMVKTKTGPSDIIDLNQLDLIFIKQLQKQNQELASKVFAELLISSQNIQLSHLWMLNNSKSRQGSFSEITFNNVIELFSNLGPNKQTIGNLISAILTQQNDISHVEKFINAAMQKNILNMETVTSAINECKPKLTDEEKGKILSEVSDESKQLAKGFKDLKNAIICGDTNDCEKLIDSLLRQKVSRDTITSMLQKHTKSMSDKAFENFKTALQEQVQDETIKNFISKMDKPNQLE